MKPVLVSLASLLGLLGCNDPPVGLPSEDPVIVPSRQWSGAEVTIQGALVESGLPRFSIRTADSVLAWRRVDDSTIAVTLPGVSSGSIALSYQSSRGTRPLGTVEVTGFKDARDIAGIVYPPVRRWPDANGQQVLGHINTGGQFAPVVLDPRTGSLKSFPGLSTAGVPIYLGTSYQQGLLLVPKRDLTERWRLEPLPTLIDSLPFSGGILFQVADSAFVFSQLNVDPTSSGTIIGRGGSWVRTFQDFRPLSHMYYSPSANRAASGVNCCSGLNNPAIPVLDMTTGDVAYRITAIKSDAAAAFSPDGNHLYMTGGITSDSSLVMLADAEDGEILATRGLQGWTAGLALGTAGLYVPVVGADCRVRLFVLDPATLALQASLGVPPDQDSCEDTRDIWAVTYSSTTRTLFVTRPTAILPGRIYQFDLRE